MDLRFTQLGHQWTLREGFPPAGSTEVTEPVFVACVKLTSDTGSYNPSAAQMKIIFKIFCLSYLVVSCVVIFAVHPGIPWVW